MNPTLDRIYWCSGVVVVYDVTSCESLAHAQNVLKLISKERPNHPCLLIGNKTDLEHARAISAQQAEELSNLYTNCTSVELSAAMDYEQVFQAFQIFLQRVALVTTRTRRKSPIKRRTSIVDMAKAFSAVFKNGRPSP